ncbi:MAG: thiol-disulfide oxidoreductase DCC family protein [Terriglobales bacterium]
MLRSLHLRCIRLHPLLVTKPLQLDGRLLVLFDGHCGLCNRAVRWFLRRDRHDRLRFAPASSPALVPILAPLLAASLDVSPASSFASPESASALATRTILVISNPGQPAKQILLRSAAILALLAELPAPWPAVARTLRIVPRPLRDLVYRLIARIRYRIWGRYDACPLPTPAERQHFL